MRESRRSESGVFLCSPIVTEVLSNSGFDWVLIDTEHAPNELPMVQQQLHAMQGGSANPVVRAAWNDRVMIKRILDIGAQSLLLPYVQTLEEAKDAVASIQYPPEGQRGVAAMTRAGGYGRIRNYIRNAASELCLLVQVESRKGMANLDAIAGVEGVDGVFIGPSDLSTDMGFFGNWRQPEVWSAIESAATKIRNAGKCPEFSSAKGMPNSAASIWDFSLSRLLPISDFCGRVTQLRIKIKKVPGKPISIPEPPDRTSWT
jgi:4-hydroxy-2-oxoheptanedioate aldolase